MELDGRCVEGGARSFQPGSRQGKGGGPHGRLACSTEIAGCRRNNRCRLFSDASWGCRTLESPENPLLKYLAVSLPAPLHSDEVSLRPTSTMPLDNVTLQGQPRISFDDQVVWPAWGSQIAATSTLLHTPKKTFGSLLTCHCRISSSTASLFKTANEAS